MSSTVNSCSGDPSRRGGTAARPSGLVSVCQGVAAAGGAVFAAGGGAAGRAILRSALGWGGAGVFVGAAGLTGTGGVSGGEGGGAGAAGRKGVSRRAVTCADVAVVTSSTCAATVFNSASCSHD